MEWFTETLIKDRAQGGKLLGRRLGAYKDYDAVVVGIPHGGVCVASAIAEQLHLPMEVMPCRKLKHPTDRTKNIGSVSSSEACVHDCPVDVPQDYIYHQMAMLRNAMAYQQKLYYEEIKSVPLECKIVILVDDVLSSSDTMLACLREIKKQNPLKIIVAVPVVAAEAASIIRKEADELVFLRMETGEELVSHRYVDFPPVDDAMVRELLEESRRKLGAQVVKD